MRNSVFSFGELDKMKTVFEQPMLNRSIFKCILVILVIISNAVALAIFFLLEFKVSGFYLNDTSEKVTDLHCKNGGDSTLLLLYAAHYCWRSLDMTALREP